MKRRIHCLYAILNAYNTVPVVVGFPIMTTNLIQQSWHVNYYCGEIRQAIMCSGEMALEGIAITFPLGLNGEDQRGSDG